MLTEVNSYIAELAGERADDGRRLVVRNGYHQPSSVAPAAGSAEVRAPRVNDKRVEEVTGERKRFSSAILQPWARKSPTVAKVLPLLYLHGLSSGDFVPALEQFLDSSAGRAHGFHLRIRLEEANAAVSVLMGMRADGTKELIAMADGYRESSEAWTGLLRDCARRGMRAPVLAVGDGTLGFWNALSEVFPDTRHQRCWVHETANVMDALRTTNPIESNFATVRLRSRVTKGAGSRAAGLAMVFKLIESARAGRRAVNAPLLVCLVRAGARFERGQLVERDERAA